MRPVLLAIIALAMTVLARPVVCSAQDDVQVTVSLAPETIGLDEQAILRVTVSGASQNIPDLQMPSLPAFEVYSQGRSSNFSIINGVMSSSIDYTYLLVPHKAGTYPIEGISVTVNNKQYVGNKVTLTVSNKGQSASPQLEQKATDAGGNSRDYFLQASVDKKNPFVNEQVTLTLKFYIAVQYYSSPELNEPTTTGFWTEVLGNSAPYFQKINGRTYRVIERKYALFPTQTGDLSIGRATITTTVAAKVQRRDPFDLFGDLMPQGVQATARSEPITLTVKPLPQTGKPDSFTGTIGRFDISARADKTEVEVNQPISVTIKIEGVGNIKSVAEPAIPDLPDFRVYRASSNENSSKTNDRLGGTKTYEEAFLPKRPGTLEIPALSFNFFDPERNRYETISTKAITVTVRKPEGYVASPDVPYSGPTMTLGNQAQDIRFIKDKLGDARPIGRLVIFTPGYLFVNGLPVVALVGLIITRRRREKLAGNVGLARARGAAKMARKRLARGKSLAVLAKSGEFFSELSLAVTAYVADKLNVSPHGITSDHLAQMLRDKAIPDDLIADTLSFLKQCDFARFAPATLKQEDLDKALADAERIMVRMEEVKFA